MVIMPWQHGAATRGEVPILGYDLGSDHPATLPYFDSKRSPIKPSRTFRPPWISPPLPQVGRAPLPPIRCILSRQNRLPPSSSPPQPQSLRPHVEFLVDTYAAAAARLVFGFFGSCEFENSHAFTALFHDGVERTTDAFVRHAGSAAWLQVVDADVPWRSCISCLRAAEGYRVRPIRKFLPFPLRFPQREEERNDGGGEWDARARNQLLTSMALMCMEIFLC